MICTLTCKMELAAYVSNIATKLPSGLAVLKTSEKESKKLNQSTH